MVGKRYRASREDLCSHFDSGKSVKQVAAIYGVQQNTVRVWCMQYRIPRQKLWSSSRPSRQELIDLLDSGKTITEIGSMYGVTRQAVGGWCRRMGIPGCGPGGKASRRPPKEELRALIDDGKTTTEIGSMYGVSSRAVRLWVRQYGLRRAGKETQSGYLGVRMSDCQAEKLRRAAQRARKSRSAFVRAWIDTLE